MEVRDGQGGVTKTGLFLDLKKGKEVGAINQKLSTGAKIARLFLNKSMLPFELDIEDAKDKIETWRKEYNSERPHSSIGNIPPEEFYQKAVAQGGYS